MNDNPRPEWTTEDWLAHAMDHPWDVTDEQTRLMARELRYGKLIDWAYRALKDWWLA